MSGGDADASSGCGEEDCCCGGAECCGGEAEDAGRALDKRRLLLLLWDAAEDANVNFERALAAAVLVLWCTCCCVWEIVDWWS